MRFGVDCSINRMVKLGPFVGKLGEERPDRACSRVRAHPVRLKKSWLPVTTGGDNGRRVESLATEAQSCPLGDLGVYSRKTRGYSKAWNREMA